MQPKPQGPSAGSMLLSVVLPIIVLYGCSGRGEGWYRLGPTAALVVALSLPVLVGVWSLLRGGAVQGLRTPLLGIFAALLTGVVSIYAQTGESEALRPSMPWVYAVKEMLVPLLAALVLTLGGGLRESGLFCTGMRAMLRKLDLQPEALEEQIGALNRQAEYRALLRRYFMCLIGGLCFLAMVKFALSLWFQLPVLELPAKDQAEGFNHAIGAITLCSTVVNMPLMVAALWLSMRFLSRLRRLAMR